MRAREACAYSCRDRPKPSVVSLTWGSAICSRTPSTCYPLWQRRGGARSKSPCSSTRLRTQASIGRSRRSETPTRTGMTTRPPTRLGRRCSESPDIPSTRHSTAASLPPSPARSPPRCTPSTSTSTCRAARTAAPSSPRASISTPCTTSSSRSSTRGSARLPLPQLCRAGRQARQRRR
jgi:hypothetical protein